MRTGGPLASYCLHIYFHMHQAALSTFKRAAKAMSLVDQIINQKTEKKMFCSNNLAARTTSCASSKKMGSLTISSKLCGSRSAFPKIRSS
jgi:hypothetical protein